MGTIALLPSTDNRGNKKYMARQRYSGKTGKTKQIAREELRAGKKDYLKNMKTR
jgi:hypothetical protein